MPEVIQALELFPWVTPEDMLRLFNECGRKKEVLVETLLASQPTDEEQKANESVNIMAQMRSQIDADKSGIDDQKSEDDGLDGLCGFIDSRNEDEEI